MSDMVDQIADILVEDHVSLMAENKSMQERIALLERALKRITMLNDHNFQLRDAMEIAESALLQEQGE